MLNAPVDLNQIASLTGLSRAELYALNPVIVVNVLTQKVQCVF
jgi:hypothetical protein